MSLKVSNKYVINIHEYMDNFLNIHYTGDNKLTHKIMNIFLYENNLRIPHRVRFSDVKKEDILRGDCLIVKDDINQKVIYSNPRSINKLMEEISQLQKQKETDNNIVPSKNKVKILSK